MLVQCFEPWLSRFVGLFQACRSSARARSELCWSAVGVLLVDNCQATVVAVTCVHEVPLSDAKMCRKSDPRGAPNGSLLRSGRGEKSTLRRDCG